MKVGEAFVEVRPDTSGFQAEADRGIGGPLKNLAKGAAAAFAAVAVKDFLGDSISGARDLAETVSKSNTIFGKAAPAIDKWASGASKAIGQSKQQALDAAATFGNMFNQLGIGTDQSAKLSKGMVTLASDFASFHNADITEVIQAQQAAFRGEYDAVQRFVPTITAAAVEQKALAMTHKATTKELTAQDKALATQALLMKGAGKAVGDFSRTSDGLANRQRILGAQMDDFRAKLGTALLPVITQVVSALSSFLPVIEPILPILLPVVGVITAVVLATKVWVAVQTALNVILAANPIGLVVIAIAALAAGIIYAYNHSETFRTIVQSVWDVLKGVAGFLVGNVVAAFGAMSTAVGAVISFIRSNWPLILAILTGPFGLAVLAIKAHIGTIVDFVRGVPRQILNALGNLDDLLVNAGKAIMRGLVNGIKAGIGGLKDTVGGIASKIVSWKGPVDYDRTILVPAGRAIMDGLRRGILGQLPNLQATLGTVTNAVSVKGGIGAATAGVGGRAVPAVAGTGPITVELVVDGKRFTAAIVDPMADALRQRSLSLR